MTKLSIAAQSVAILLSIFFILPTPLLAGEHDGTPSSSGTPATSSRPRLTNRPVFFLGANLTYDEAEAGCASYDMALPSSGRAVQLIKKLSGISQSMITKTSVKRSSFSSEFFRVDAQGKNPSTKDLRDPVQELSGVEIWMKGEELITNPIALQAEITYRSVLNRYIYENRRGPVPLPPETFPQDYTSSYETMLFSGDETAKIIQSRKRMGRLADTPKPTHRAFAYCVEKTAN